MELWIRSQDRECIMKVDRIDYDYGCGEHKIKVNGFATLIGIYATKERALEVLDEIQTQLVTLNYQYIHRGEHFIATESNVYEMPNE